MLTTLYNLCFKGERNIYIYVIIRFIMGWNDSGKVIFNEGVAITIRLDNIQREITQCSLNPSAMNVKYNEFNYKVWLRLLTALLREISADISKKKTNDKKTKEKMISEFEFAENIRKSIKKFEIKYPVYKTIKLKVPPYTNKIKRDDKALDIIVEKLNDFGIYIMALKKKYGYGNPTSDDPRSAMLR